MAYVNYSMSVNAYNCYQSNIKPISRWTKSDILQAIAEAVTEGLKLNISIDLMDSKF